MHIIFTDVIMAIQCLKVSPGINYRILKEKIIFAAQNQYIKQISAITTLVRSGPLLCTA
jgi:hypothetical protein